MTSLGEKLSTEKPHVQYGVQKLGDMSALTFYIAKMGYAGLYLFFLFLLQNIDCGSRRSGSNVVRHSMFLAKIFKICITHGQVFVM